MQSVTVDMNDPIPAASALLCTVLHCRKQAEALQNCYREQNGQTGGKCSAKEQAFMTCSEAHAGMVVQHLVKVADRYCQAEVQAFAHCKRVTPGSNCEAEDMAAMKCAALAVLKSASEAAAEGQ